MTAFILTSQLQAGNFFIWERARLLKIATFCEHRKYFLYQSFLTAFLHINKYRYKHHDSKPYQHYQRQKSLFMLPSPTNQGGMGDALSSTAWRKKSPYLE